MSAAEIIWDIPALIENRKRCCEPNIDMEAGEFPFERRERQDTDQSFRHQLDDIAQRHPELAEHLQGFPRRSTEESDEFFRRRPFGGRLKRFGFPLNREDLANTHHQPQKSQQPAHSQHPENSQQENYASEGQESSQNPAPSKISQATQTEVDSNSPTIFQERLFRGRPIQQSNTCDLTQKQEPDNLTDREQRSMSAPPDNKQRFVSSAHIPMGNKAPVNNEQQQAEINSGSSERVIPIHVEGRDEPIIPKTVIASSATPQPERMYSEDVRAQPERIFGQRPEQFTQFVREPQFGNDGWHHPVFERRHGFPEEEFLASPEFTTVKPQPEQQQQKAYQYSQLPHQTEQSVPPQQKQQPPKPQPNQSSGPIEQIQSIQKDVSELLIQVEQFSGLPKDKAYLYLDEMLTRNLLKLDNIDTQGQDSIRSARKEAIRCIEKAIGVLEAKATANLPKDEPMETATEEELAVQPINARPAESSVDRKDDTNSIEEVKSMELIEIPKMKPTGSEEKIKFVTNESEPQSQKSEDLKQISSSQPYTETGADNKKGDVESTDGKQKKIKI